MAIYTTIVLTQLVIRMMLHISWPHLIVKTTAKSEIFDLAFLIPIFGRIYGWW